MNAAPGDHDSRNETMATRVRGDRLAHEGTISQAFGDKAGIFR